MYLQSTLVGTNEDSDQGCVKKIENEERMERSRGEVDTREVT